VGQFELWQRKRLIGLLAHLSPVRDGHENPKDGRDAVTNAWLKSFSTSSFTVKIAAASAPARILRAMNVSKMLIKVS
jgi:hypothetical protein